MKSYFLDHLWLVEAKQIIRTKWEDKELWFSLPKKQTHKEIGSSYNDILFPKMREEEFEKLKSPSNRVN